MEEYVNMATTAFLVPKGDILVRDPISKDILQTTGEVKPLIGPEGRYWKRRIRDGSVIVSSTVTTKSRVNK